MTDLETIVQKPTLWQELTQSAKNYPRNWVDSMKGFGVPCLASLAGSTVGQVLAEKYWPGNAAAAGMMAIACGYPLGYSTIFGIEIARHKEKYRGMKNIVNLDYIFHPEKRPETHRSLKLFKDYVVSFLAADYVSDLAAFQPPFWAANIWLTHHTQFNPVQRNAIAWGGAGLVWVSAMALMYPVAKVVNEYVNRGVKSVYDGIKNILANADLGPGF